MPVMVTMKLWLGRLAAGFALTAGGFSSYVYLQTADGRRAVAEARAAQPHIAKAVDEAVIEGQAALDWMIESALLANGEKNYGAVNHANPAEIANGAPGETPAAERHRAELNFRIVSNAADVPASPHVAPGAEVADAAVAAPAQIAARDVVKSNSPLAPAAAAVAELPAQAAQAAAPVISAAPQAVNSLRLADGQRGEERKHPVEARLKARVPGDMREFFDLYLYVSKAEKGSWAQRMYVMAKQPDDSFAPLYTWVVSTGKEEMMVNPHGVTMSTDTPEGFFRLDRGRFFADYTSYQWKAPMPHAMFFDWQIEGRRSGLAIHGTGPNEDQLLGARASKGCIRLSPENAGTLFKLITENYAGKVPQLRIDSATGTQSTNGLMRRDAQGRIMTKRGYRVLVVIENYGGPTTETIATIM